MVSAVCILAFCALAAAAELPPPRRPSPFPAEPPNAETMRRLHEMMAAPRAGEDMQPMSEEEAMASFQRFLDARGGRIEPIWANHSHAERTANLRQHHAKRQSERQSERRRLQMGWITGSQFADGTTQAKDSSLTAVFDAPSSTCDDPLASNTGRLAPCTYDCREYSNGGPSRTIV